MSTWSDRERELEGVIEGLERQLTAANEARERAERQLAEADDEIHCQHEACTELERKVAELEEENFLLRDTAKGLEQRETYLSERVDELEEALQQAKSAERGVIALGGLIEELRAELQQAQTEANQYRLDLAAEFEGSAALREKFGAREDEGMETFVGRLAREARQAQAELSRATATAAGLREALQPFARMAEGMDDRPEDMSCCQFPTIGQVRNARSALSTSAKIPTESARERELLDRVERLEGIAKIITQQFPAPWEAGTTWADYDHNWIRCSDGDVFVTDLPPGLNSPLTNLINALSPEASRYRYEQLEREHLGDPDKKTGIYAEQQTSESEGDAQRCAVRAGKVHCECFYSGSQCCGCGKARQEDSNYG